MPNRSIRLFCVSQPTLNMECCSKANFKAVSEGRAPQSQLEEYSKRLEVYYKILEGNEIDPTPPWTAKDGLAKEHLAAVSLCQFDR